MNSKGLFLGLRNISNISSRTSKLVQLKALQIEHGKDLLKVLQYAYDPFKRYYITPYLYRSEGSNDIDHHGFDILDRLASRELSGYMAAETLKDYMASLNPESRILFSRIVKKDLRIGMAAKSINAVFPYLIQIVRAT